MASAIAVAAGEPVFAYFTADWHVSGGINESAAIKTEAAARVFKVNGVMVTVGGWTSQNPSVTEILVRSERARAADLFVFRPGATGDEWEMLPQILTPGVIVEVVSGAG